MTLFNSICVIILPRTFIIILQNVLYKWAETMLEGDFMSLVQKNILYSIHYCEYTVSEQGHRNLSKSFLENIMFSLIVFTRGLKFTKWLTHGDYYLLLPMLCTYIVAIRIWNFKFSYVVLLQCWYQCQSKYVDLYPNMSEVQLFPKERRDRSWALYQDWKRQRLSSFHQALSTWGRKAE